MNNTNQNNYILVNTNTNHINNITIRHVINNYNLHIDDSNDKKNDNNIINTNLQNKIIIKPTNRQLF